MKILNFFITLLHLAVVFALYLVFFNDWISVEKTSIPEFMALLFPVLVVVYLVLTIFWIFSWKKRAILFILLFIPLFTAVLRWVNFSPKNLVSENSLKIISYNMHNGYAENRQNLEGFLAKYPADIVVAQEAGGGPQFMPKSEIYPNNILKYRHIAIYTKGKILQERQIEMPCNCNGDAQFADIEINGKMIRLINVYLEPFYIIKPMVKPTENMAQNENKYKVLTKSMREAFKTHQVQVDAIVPYIKNSPYPVILSGDFNSVPNSYEYFHLKNNLKDGFTEAGNGSGTSFHDFKFPLRIDYIFGSKEVKFLDYKVRRDIRYSDHFPVFATVEIR